MSWIGFVAFCQTNIQLVILRCTLRSVSIGFFWIEQRDCQLFGLYIGWHNILTPSFGSYAVSCLFSASREVYWIFSLLSIILHCIFLFDISCLHEIYITLVYRQSRLFLDVLQRSWASGNYTLMQFTAVNDTLMQFSAVNDTLLIQDHIFMLVISSASWRWLVFIWC